MEKIVLIILVCAACLGCDKNSEVDPVTQPPVVVDKALGDVKWQFKTDGRIYSSPAIAKGVAYIGSEDKNLYAINVTGGDLKWKFQTDGAVHSSPEVYKDVVYFGSLDGHYYAVDANTGVKKWKFETGGEKRLGEVSYWGMQPSDMYMEDPWDYFISSPVLNKNDEALTVYFGSSDGNVYALNATDGTPKWSFATNGIIHTSPVLSNNTIYIGSWDTYMYALDAETGEQKWKFKTGDQIAMTGIQSSVAVDDGIVYFGARDANFYALNEETGALVWKYAAEGSWILNTASVKDGRVYLGTSDSFLLLSLDAKTGVEKFRFKANGYVYSSPFVTDKTVYFGDYTGKMFAVDIASDGKKWREFSTESRNLHASQVLKADYLDFTHLAEGKDLMQYSATTDVMDILDTLGPIVSSPTVDGGVLYFGSADGNFYAITLK